jgi:hypothetical protein
MGKVILQCGGGWPTNIGNAFLDYGVKYLLREVMPEHSITICSNAVNWIYSNYGNKDFFNIARIAEVDYFVFAGSMLAIQWFKEHSDLFKFLSKTQSKILMIGVSGETYSEKEIYMIKKYLKKLNVKLFISRDEECFNHYFHDIEFTYNGIDSAFFLSDGFKPLAFNTENYNIFCFDSMEEPNIEARGKILRTHHAPWKVLSNQLFSKKDILLFLESIKNSQRNIVRKTDLISDLPQDYLNLYANCNATYSDRIHACVAALTFGKYAQLYNKSSRSHLFDRLELNDIRDELVKLNSKKLLKEKENQKDYIKEILTK